MSEITYDEFLDKLGPDDLTDDNFQTLLSSPPKAEDLMQSDLSDSMNTSLPPCIVSSKCHTLSSTTINPLTLENSPRGFGNDSVEEFVQPKKKSSSLGPRQVYLIAYFQGDILKVQNRKQFVEFACEEFNWKDEIVEHWMVSAELHRQKCVSTTTLQ